MQGPITPEMNQVNKFPTTPTPVPRLIITPSTPLKTPLLTTLRAHVRSSSRVRFPSFSFEETPSSNSVSPSGSGLVSTFSYDSSKFDQEFNRQTSNYYKRHLQDSTSRSRFASIILFVLAILLVLSSAAISTSSVGLANSNNHLHHQGVVGTFSGLTNAHLHQGTKAHWIGSKVNALLAMDLRKSILKSSSHIDTLPAGTHASDSTSGETLTTISPPAVEIISTTGDKERAWTKGKREKVQSLWSNLMMRANMARGQIGSESAEE